MSRFVLIFSIVFAATFTLAETDASAQFGTDECLPFDIRCQNNVERVCDQLDFNCGKNTEECLFWKSDCSDNTSTSPTGWPKTDSASIKYSERVSCSLVLDEGFRISGYCNVSTGANLMHCVIDEVGFWDPYSVEFLCAKGTPSILERPSRNEVMIENLGSSVSLGGEYWIICDEGFGALTKNKRCYDSDFSNGDDWSALCEPDDRLSKVFDYPHTYVWLVCA